MHKKIITGFVVAATMAPAFAFAQTTDTQAQIQALLQQIQALQQQLRTIVQSAGSNFMMGTSTPGQIGKMACITLSRNLRQGDSGDDVRKLQELLSSDNENEFHGGATGFFGPLTMKAMMKFQMRMGIASSTDGSVGPLTRGFFERQCGRGLDGNRGPGGNSGPGGGGDGMGKMPGGMNSAAIRGTISANNTSNIIIQTNGGTVTVNITASTSIKVFVGTSTPPTPGSVANLTVGKNVMIEGQRNFDGSITARNIAVGDNLPMLKSHEDEGMEMEHGMLIPHMMQGIGNMIQGINGSIVPGGDDHGGRGGGGNSGPGGGGNH